jgi:hypothetical protein
VVQVENVLAAHLSSSRCAWISLVSPSFGRVMLCRKPTEDEERASLKMLRGQKGHF